MNVPSFEQVEREIDRELQALRDATSVDLPPALLARTRAAVQAEAARLGAAEAAPSPRSAPWWLPHTVGVAAAVALLFVMMRGTLPQPTSIAPSLENDVALDAWAAALSESGAQLALQMDGYGDSSFGDDGEEWLSFDDLADDQGA